MKNIIKKTRYVVSGAFLLSLSFSIAYTQGMKRGRAGGQRGMYGEAYVKSLPKETLSKDEVRSITHMREEEKLARDVYNKLYEYWKLPIFSNIAKSEQRHMDMVGLLIEKYELNDPVKADSPGKFNDPEMQKLYDKLIAEGKKSLNDALKVGCLIEDLDIYDLNAALTKVDNQDIKYVYTNIRRGSYNHLNSFYNTLKRYGGTYTPQYISQDEFDRIISLRTTGRPGRKRGRGFAR